MKTIIVYYSLEGNTEYVARKIADSIGADILRIYPKKAYPDSGFRKYFWGGKSAVMAETPPLEPYKFELSAYERVILGFPVWAGNVAPPLRTFIKENPLNGKSVVVFACQSGSGAEKAFSKLRKCIGTDKFEAELIMVDPKTKPSDDNEQKIRKFCDKLR